MLLVWHFNNNVNVEKFSKYATKVAIHFFLAFARDKENFSIWDQLK